MWAPVPLGQGAEVTLIIAVLVLAAILALFFDTRSFQKKRSRFPYRLFKFGQKPDLTDVGQQLRAVMVGSFEKRRVLSTAEYRVFAIIEGEIAAQAQAIASSHRPVSVKFLSRAIRTRSTLSTVRE